MPRLKNLILPEGNHVTRTFHILTLRKNKKVTKILLQSDCCRVFDQSYRPALIVFFLEKRLSSNVKYLNRIFTIISSLVAAEVILSL